MNISRIGASSLDMFASAAKNGVSAGELMAMDYLQQSENMNLAVIVGIGRIKINGKVSAPVKVVNAPKTSTSKRSGNVAEGKGTAAKGTGKTVTRTEAELDALATDPAIGKESYTQRPLQNVKLELVLKLKVK